uniref:Retrovirus-related Pol polyprotein from transposon TNT 1-94-like beta-barrel domain-containing protein n=1 Tax=Lactuca sativa TaxID=4236 RepID=A0A9R1UUZ8_LACSA|nr:hypothetical protein LSAT_V11C800418370 [Lactuca sativa]
MTASLTRAKCVGGWFVDTGDIMHVFGKRESFCTYRPTPLGTIVVCANSHTDEVQGRGDVRFNFTLGEWVTLQDVLHVPTISKGLVSIDKFDKGGFKTELGKGWIVITKGIRYIGRVKNCS